MSESENQRFDEFKISTFQPMPKYSLKQFKPQKTKDLIPDFSKKSTLN